MNRRHLLMLTAGGLAGTAGCSSLGDPDSSSVSDPTGNQTPSEPNPPRVDVELETAQYLIYSYEHPPEDRAIDPDSIVPESDLPDPLQTALNGALDGGFETDEVSEALLTAIDQFRFHGTSYRFEPYVQLDKTPYAFDPDVPEFVAHLERDIDGADPARTVDHDALEQFEEPVKEFVRTIGAFTPGSPYDEYRVSVLPPAVETFLDQYEYVGDPRGIGRIVTERIDPAPPYTIDLAELTIEDLWGRTVIEEESLDEELLRFLKTAVASERRAPLHHPFRSEHRADRVPETYFDQFERPDGSHRNPYGKLDGTVYEFEITEIERSKLPVDVSVQAIPSDNKSTFSVTITPSEAKSKPAMRGAADFETRGALPSVLWVETDADRYLLSSDRYDSIKWESSGGSRNDGEQIRNLDQASLSLNDELSATYRIPDSVPAGTYNVWGGVSVSWRDARTDTQYPKMAYPFQIRTTIRRPDA